MRLARMLLTVVAAAALAAIPASAGTFPWGADETLLAGGQVVAVDGHAMTIGTDEFRLDLPAWMHNPRFTFYAGHLIRVAVDVSDVNAAWDACDAIYGKPIWVDDVGPVVRWVAPGEAIELRPARDGHELVWAATEIIIPDAI